MRNMIAYCGQFHFIEDNTNEFNVYFQGGIIQ
jgi:hypothetical protein